jgi:hypothetical protein
MGVEDRGDEIDRAARAERGVDDGVEIGANPAGIQ